MNEEKQFYKEETVKMLNAINNELILKLIYGFVRSGYREEVAGKGGAE